jgi:hypothetical protein
MMAEETDEQMTKSMRIMSKLIDNAHKERQDAAKAQSATCLRCFDTGLDCGRFCDCEAGAKLHYGHG